MTAWKKGKGKRRKKRGTNTAHYERNIIVNSNDKQTADKEEKKEWGDAKTAFLSAIMRPFQSLCKL